MNTSIMNNTSVSAAVIDSQQLLKMVNDARKQSGEPEIRNNKFIEKIEDELEGDGYTKSATVPQGGGTPMTVITMTYRQALRVAARESKAVRRSLVEKTGDNATAATDNHTPGFKRTWRVAQSQGNGNNREHGKNPA